MTLLQDHIEIFAYFCWKYKCDFSEMHKNKVVSKVLY